jgi:hypothetical protein
LTSGRRLVVKIIAEFISQHDERHVAPTPLSEIRVRKRTVMDCDKLSISDVYSISHS